MCIDNDFDSRLIAYICISWVLEYNSVSNGLGFPFDRRHLEFNLRLNQAYQILKRLKQKGVNNIPVDIISRTLRDRALQNLVQKIQDKAVIFDEFREAMRIACPDKNKGLNDNGDEDIKTIEKRVNNNVIHPE